MDKRIPSVIESIRDHTDLVEALVGREHVFGATIEIVDPETLRPVGKTLLDPPETFVRKTTGILSGLNPPRRLSEMRYLLVNGKEVFPLSREVVAGTFIHACVLLGGNINLYMTEEALNLGFSIADGIYPPVFLKDFQEKKIPFIRGVIVVFSDSDTKRPRVILYQVNSVPGDLKLSFVCKNVTLGHVFVVDLEPHTYFFSELEKELPDLTEPMREDLAICYLALVLGANRENLKEEVRKEVTCEEIKTDVPGVSFLIDVKNETDTTTIAAIAAATMSCF